MTANEAVFAAIVILDLSRTKPRSQFRFIRDLELPCFLPFRPKAGSTL